MQAEHFCQTINDRSRATHIARTFHYLNIGHALQTFGQRTHGSCRWFILFVTWPITENCQSSCISQLIGKQGRQGTLKQIRTIKCKNGYG